ncbi:MAG: helix-hairpin-helix domain-containing protein, partial [[Eubacterium] saphenum]|nr:helix-hairpin-helix domain-containing protein [[Eubacterium] saphenum]
FDADGSLHLARANLIAYAHGEYFPLRERPEGFFGYSVAREEVLRRRLTRFAEGDEDFAPLPDLILLDGGRGHISAVSEVFGELGVKIPLFGLVKDSKHRTRAIAEAGGEIEIKSNRALFDFLTNIQDEVHRWAISYQRVKHKQALFASELRQVKGIGEAKQTALLRHFKTKQAMKAATVDELREVAKINADTARELHEFIQANF